MKLTPWFPGTVKPVRVGWYELEPHLSDNNPWKEYWDGAFWKEHPKVVIPQYITPDSYGQTGWRWRGLTEEAK